MTRKVQLSIAPATETTCGDGSGKFCPFVRSGRFGQQWFCAVHYSKDDSSGMTELGTTERGWLKRLDACLASEAAQ